VKTALLWLVRLFPEPFQDQFGASVEEDVATGYAAARDRGAFAAAWFTIATGVDLVLSAIAEQWSPSWVSYAGSTGDKGMRAALEELGKDLRLAVRGLRRSPGFAAVAIGTLGLAIGANAGLFNVVNAVILNPLPYANADRLFFVTSIAPGSQFQGEFGVSNEFYLMYKESKLVEDLSTFGGGTSTFRVGDRVERVPMGFSTVSLFTTLGGKPLIGRLPVAADEGNAVVLSYLGWNTWFGGDPNVLGQTHEVSGARRQIVGVMGPDFRYPMDGVIVWVNSEVTTQGLVPGRFNGVMVARLAPGVTKEAAATEFTTIARRAPERFGGSPNYAKLMQQIRAVVRPLDEDMFGDVRRPLFVLLGAVGIVLIIACANVANLFLVRTEGRHRELAVRRAIGAARGQLIRLQLAESFAVAAGAGVVAVLLAWLSLPLILRSAPQGIPRLVDAGMDGTTLLVTLGLAIAAALACGLVPAIRASSPDLMRLRDGGRGSTGRRHWGRDGLVVAQTALALVLLIGSGLLMRSFAKLSTVNPGYSTKDIFTFQFAPQQQALNDGPAWARFHLNFMDRLRALPGVESVGFVDNIPLDEGTGNVRFITEGTAQEADAGVRLNSTFAAGDYFKAMGIAFKAGRALTTDEQLSGQGLVVISRSAASQLWPGQDAVGRRLQPVFLDGGANQANQWLTVVGVVDDVMQYGFRGTAQATVYLPMVGPTPTTWRVTSPGYAIKSKRAEIIAPEVRALVKDVAPEAPMYRAYTMEFLAKRSLLQLSFTMMTLGIAAGLALILGAVGLYGVLSYVVAERTREIGVRMALGAEASQVLRMVVGQGARVVGLGVAIGVVIAFLSRKALGNLLFGVAPFDLATFVAMSAAMLAVGMFASYMPARRASNVDPVESLRGD
jgi:putative ABC transport system permease protein